jgi:dihydrofolate reductase
MRTATENQRRAGHPQGDVVTEVSKLSRELDGDIVVYASFQLVLTLIEHGLIDQLRLMVYPFVLGAGERLFGETNNKLHLHLVDNRTLGDDLAYVIYDVVRAAQM